MAPLFEAGDSWAERAGFWLFLSHLAVIFAIAISEVLLGLTVLSLPWTRRRGVTWSVLAPLAIPVGIYLLLLVGSIVASPDPRASTRGLTDFFTFTTLLMAPFLVRGERQVRLVVDSLIVLAALLATEGLAQFLFGYGDIDRRIRGPFSHYMTFSGFLLVCDLLLLAAMIYTRRWRTPWRPSSAPR